MENIADATKKLQISDAWCRRATHEDYEAVMDIDRNIYDGLDYLPYLYHSYIDHPRRHCYVCLQHGHIVGFEMFFLVDEGRMVVSQAGRTKAGLRGQGISGMLVRYASKETLNRYPLQSVAWTTKHEAASRKIQEKNKFLSMTRRPRTRFHVTSSGLSHVIKSNAFQLLSNRYSTEKLRVLAPRETEDTMASISNLQDFLPSGLWCMKFEVFSTSPSDHSIVTRDFQSKVVTSTKAGGRVKDISFQSAHRCNFGHRVMLDFYVDKNLDDQSKSNLLVGHVMKHLILIGQTKWLGKIYVGIDMHEFQGEREIPREDLKRVLLNELPLSSTEHWLYQEECAFVLQLPISPPSAKL